MFKLCYVTAFLDIDRNEWTEFQRSFDDYFNSFLPLVNLFRSMKDNKSLYHLVVFIDKKHSDKVRDACNGLSNIDVIDIDETFLQNNIFIWSRLTRETEIMNTFQFRELMSKLGRLKYPEHNNPRYTLINHAKIDFVNHAIKLQPNCDYFCWVDFGYFAKADRIAQYPLDINLFQHNKVNYTLINNITREDSDILYTLTHAPERIGGFFFFGNRHALQEYQKLFHAMHRAFQQSNIADDDQHIALQCYFHKPDLFAMHYLGGWHKALTHFQRTNNELYKPSLTEIMNRYGSDKGSGHHNYTNYYSKLLEPFREEKINMLEIGIGTNNPNIASSMCGTPGGYKPGSSLRGWEEYFSNGRIYGCDVDKDILFEQGRISTFFLDQTNPTTVNEQIVNKELMFDIIVDDGLHHFPTNFNVLKQIFCKLNKGGVYIIEDIVDFDERVLSDPFLREIEFCYIKVPNPRNPADNNIVVVRHKGEKIAEL